VRIEIPDTALRATEKMLNIIENNEIKPVYKTLKTVSDGI